MFPLLSGSKQSSRKTYLWALAVGTIFLLALVQQVTAGTINTIPGYGFLNGVTAYAEVRSFPGTNSNANCTIKSYTSPATNINVIRWTWRQCDLLKNGVIIQNGSQLFPGSTKNGSSHQALAQFNNLPPGAYSQIKSHGVHDFNHNGSNPSPWRPYNVNIYP
jgi:hypothetical protein